MAIVTPTDRPKSVRNRCVIEVFCVVFVFSSCFVDCSVSVGAFVIRLSQISSFFTSFRRSLSSLHVFNPKNHKMNLIWCKTFCWNALQNLLTYVFEEAKQTSLTSVIGYSHFAWISTKALFYILSRLSASKLFRETLTLPQKHATTVALYVQNYNRKLMYRWILLAENWWLHII